MRWSSTRIRRVVPVALVLVAFAAGACAAATSPIADAPGTTAAGGACAWPIKASKDSLNIAYPDTSATYWTLRYSLAPGERMTISGRFPDARYMSYTTYASTAGALGSVKDADITPDPGSTNPFRGQPQPNLDARHYTVTIGTDAVPASPGPGNFVTATSIPNSSGSTNTVAPDANGTVPANAGADDGAVIGSGGQGGVTGTLIYRIYVSATDNDPTGDVGLPDLAIVDAGGKSTAVPTCPSPGGSEGLTRVVETYGQATNAQPGPEPGFFRLPRGLGNLYPNADNVYIATIAKHAAGEVIVIRGQSPTFPDTRAGATITGNDQVRYWSLCTNEYRKPYPVSFCKRDDEAVLDADGHYTFVISTPEDRPANATATNGVTWLDYGNANVNAVLLFRHMAAAPDFAQSSAHLAPAQPAAAVMGPYTPVSRYCSRTDFEAGGAAACGV